MIQTKGLKGRPHRRKQRCGFAHAARLGRTRLLQLKRAFIDTKSRHDSKIADAFKSQ
jgi:hypothetical protein